MPGRNRRGRRTLQKGRLGRRRSLGLVPIRVSNLWIACGKILLREGKRGVLKMKLGRISIQLPVPFGSIPLRRRNCRSFDALSPSPRSRAAGLVVARVCDM